MSVDKFGRISSSSRGVPRSVKGERGVGFSLTKEGDYDMGKKTLKNLNTPVDEQDAATKKYVDDGLEKIGKELIFVKEDGESKFFKRKLYVNGKIDKLSIELASQKEYIESVDVKRKKYVDDLIAEIKREYSLQRKYIELLDDTRKLYVDENLQKLYKELSDIHVGYTRLKSQ